MEVPASPQSLANVPTATQKDPGTLDNEQRILEEMRARALEIVHQSTTQSSGIHVTATSGDYPARLFWAIVADADC